LTLLDRHETRIPVTDNNLLPVSKGQMLSEDLQIHRPQLAGSRTSEKRKRSVLIKTKAVIFDVEGSMIDSVDLQTYPSHESWGGLRSLEYKMPDQRARELGDRFPHPAT